MSSGIARQAIRRHRWTLFGPACTQLLAAAVIGVMVMTGTSLHTSLTSAQRADPGLRDLLDFTTVFLGDAVYLTVVIIGVTMGLAMSGQLRDVALLRSLGASPKQVRRSAALQALCLVLPMTMLGVLIAVAAGEAWMGLLRHEDVLPPNARFSGSFLALPVALGVLVVTSVVGSSIAALRVSRLKPAAALVEVSAGRTNGVLRSVTGILLVIVGIALSAALSMLAPSRIADAGVFVLIAECVGVGMVAPGVLLKTVRAASRVTSSSLLRLALEDLTTMTRSLSGALVPLVLAVAFAAIKILAHSTAAHVTGILDPAQERWLDYSGTAIFGAFAGVAALNCFITVIVKRRVVYATMQLAGASRWELIALVVVQTIVVTMVATVLAGFVVAVTLVPILHATLHTVMPYAPPVFVVAGELAIGAVVAAGLLVPVAILSRRPAVRVMMSSS